MSVSITRDNWYSPVDEAWEPLVALHDLEQIDSHWFRSDRHIPNHRHVLFGGQVLSQSLCAASQTVSDKLAHSLHGYFLRPGSSEQAVNYHVQTLREGRGFTTCRVDAKQEGRIIFTMDASFHGNEAGFEHQLSQIVAVPPPEDCVSAAELRRGSTMVDPEVMSRMEIIDMRPVRASEFLDVGSSEPRAEFWLRAARPLPEDPALQRCVLALMSDRALMSTCLKPHATNLFEPDMLVASLDHSLWLHGSFAPDQWLLYCTDSPWAGQGRGLNRGSIFTRDGILVATVAQEGLIRRLTP